MIQLKSELSVERAAGILGVSPRMLRIYIDEKKIKALKVGRKWFVDAASVEVFRAKLHSEPSVPELAVKNELISQKASETPSPLTLQSLACYRLSLECFSLP